MNYFDDYYSSQEPQEEQNNYIPPEEPKPPKQPKEHKERKGLKRLLSVVLVIALVAGSCGATALVLNSYWQKEMNAMMQRMEDKIAAAQKQPAQATVSSRPVSSTGMTPGDVYAQNVIAVVAITAEVTKPDS